MPATSFRQLIEKGLSSKISFMQWSPKMDLLAMINEEGEVLLHRLSLLKDDNVNQNDSLGTLQQVWTIKTKDDDSGHEATSLVWRPDGIVLAVGLSNGEIKLYNAEDAEFLHVVKTESAVTHLEWELTQTKLSQEKKVTLTIEPSVFMPKLPTLSQSYGTFFSKNSEEQNPESSKLIHGQERLTVLVVGSQDCKLHLFAFGICPIVMYDASEYCLSGKARTLSTCLSDDLQSLTWMFQEEAKELPSSSSSLTQNTCFKLVNCETTLLHSRQEEIYVFAVKYTLLTIHVKYLLLTMKAMSEVYEDILLMMDSKLTTYANERGTEGSVSDDFLFLLMWGNPSPELLNFLVNVVTEKGLKKVGQSIETCYSNLQKLIIRNVHFVCRAMIYHLTDLQGYSDWYDKYGILGLRPSSIHELISSVGSFMLKTSEMLQVIDGSLKSFKAFFKWLYVVILRLSDQPVSKELNQMNHAETVLVAEFIKESLGNAAEGEQSGNKRFKLERVGQYLNDVELQLPVTPAHSPWAQAVTSSQDLRDSQILYPAHPHKSLVSLWTSLKESMESTLSRPAVVISNSVQSTTICEVANINSLVPKDRPPLVDQRTISGNIYSIFSSTIPGDFFHMVWHGVKLDSPDDVQSLRLKVGRLGPVNDIADGCAEHKLLDIHFYNDETITLLLKEAAFGEEDNSVLAQLSLSALLALQPQPFDPSPTADRPCYDIGPHIVHYSHLKNLKASFCAVSGSRKVSSLLFARHQRIRLYDMEEEEEEEEDEEDEEETGSGSGVDLSD